MQIEETIPTKNKHLLKDQQLCIIILRIDTNYILCNMENWLQNYTQEYNHDKITTAEVISKIRKTKFRHKQTNKNMHS